MSDLERMPIRCAEKLFFRNDSFTDKFYTVVPLNCEYCASEQDKGTEIILDTLVEYNSRNILSLYSNLNYKQLPDDIHFRFGAYLHQMQTPGEKFSFINLQIKTPETEDLYKWDKWTYGEVYYYYDDEYFHIYIDYEGWDNIPLGFIYQFVKNAVSLKDMYYACYTVQSLINTLARTHNMTAVADGTELHEILTRDVSERIDRKLQKIKEEMEGKGARNR